MFMFLLALFPLVVCRVYALPVSRASMQETYCIPLVVLSVVLFLLLVAIKLVYVKQRRIGTIHAPSVPSSRDKEDRGLVVGCLGSPAWETNLTARLGGASSFARTSTRSTCAATVTTFDSQHGHVRPCGLGFQGNSVGRASPSSIRLVDGPGQSGQVAYAFLSGLPPTAIIASPLTSARDSFQLSRCDRKAVPPLPPLPSFLVQSPIVFCVQETAPLRPKKRLQPCSRMSPISEC